MKSVFLFLLLCCYAQAAVWYVDYEGGSDAAAGTSTGAAWKHCPGDPAATGVAASATIAAGDTIAFKAGTSYILESTAIILKSGAVGNRIVYDFDYWGTGADCIFTNNNSSSTYVFSDGGTAKSNFTMSDFKIENVGGYPDDSPVLVGTTVTEINASTDTVTTATAHGFTAGTKIYFTMDGYSTTETGAVIVGDAKAYRYVVSTPTTTSFTMSTTSGGSALNITTVGSGAFKVWRPVTSPLGGAGINLNGGGDNITIENFEMVKLGQWRPVAPFDGTNAVTGYGIQLRNNNTVLIRNGVFDRLKSAVVVGGTNAGPTENITIENCTMTRMGWGIDTAYTTTGATFRNLLYRNNTFSEKSYYDQENWNAGGGFGDSVHTNGMFFRTANIVGTWDNIVVDACKFFNDTTTGAGGSYDVFVSQGPSLRVQNCLFLRGRDNNALNIGYWKPSGMTQTIEVFNNTFVSDKLMLKMTVDTVFPNRVDVRNNLFVSTATSTVALVNALPSGFVDKDWNNNIYWKVSPIPSASATILFNTTTGQPNRTFNSWKAAFTGVDTASQLADPLLASISGIPSTWQVWPLEGSPAIGAGQNLSEFFTTDYAGTTRHPTDPWTVGAYSAAYTPPTDVTAPTILTATINSSGTGLTIVADEPVQGVDAAHYAVSGHTLSSATGSGTTWSMTLSPAVQAGAVKTLGYTSGSGRTRDLADNLLATFSGFAITNNSLEPTPSPPFAPRKGRGIRGVMQGR